MCKIFIVSWKKFILIDVLSMYLEVVNVVVFYVYKNLSYFYIVKYLLEKKLGI